jgi:hypothetical protein
MEKSQALARVKRRGMNYFGLPLSLQMDRDVCLATVMQYGALFNWLPIEFKADKAIAIAAAEKNIKAIGRVAPELRSDPDIAALIAKNRNPNMQWTDGRRGDVIKQIQDWIKMGWNGATLEERDSVPILNHVMIHYPVAIFDASDRIRSGLQSGTLELTRVKYPGIPEGSIAVVEARTPNPEQIADEMQLWKQLVLLDPEVLEYPVPDELFEDTQFLFGLSKRFGNTKNNSIAKRKLFNQVSDRLEQFSTPETVKLMEWYYYFIGFLTKQYTQWMDAIDSRNDASLNIWKKGLQSESSPSEIKAQIKWVVKNGNPLELLTI